MKATYTEILNFIYNTPSWREYLKGGCYKFYLILKEKFPEAEAYYDDNHVITKIRNNYYDVTGVVIKNKHINVDNYYTHEFMEKIFKI